MAERLFRVLNGISDLVLERALIEAHGVCGLRHKIARPVGKRGVLLLQGVAGPVEGIKGLADGRLGPRRIG